MPLFWISLAFLGGILLADLVHFPWWAWLGAAVSVLALAALSRLARLPTRLRDWLAWIHRPLPQAAVAPAALLAALCLGGLRLELAHPPLGPDHVARRNGQGVVTVEGVIAAPPDVRDRAAGLRIQAERISPPGQPDAPPSLPVQGTLLAWAAPGGGWRYGDRVQVTGDLTAPEDAASAGEGGFSYREVLARQGIHSQVAFGRVRLIERGQGNPVMAAAFSLRERALQVVERLLPAPESALLSGILLGEEQGLPAGLQQAFKDSGTSHLIAISGYNMTVLAGLLVALFGRLLGRGKGALAAAAGIAFYTLLVGGQPSAVRAAIMGVFGLFGRLIGRRSSGLNALLIAAGLMCLFDPQSMWDVGFQLSFFATLGLILYAEPLAAWAVRGLERWTFFRQAHPGLARRLVERWGDGLTFTLAAQVTTLPLLAAYFGQVAPAAFLSNPLVLPAQPPLMVFGGLAALFGSVSLPLGQPFAWLAWPFLAYTVRIAELFGSLASAGFLLPVAALPGLAALLIAYYILLFGLTGLPQVFPQALAHARARLATWSGGWRPNAVLVVLAAAACLVWRAAASAPDGRLHLTLLEGGVSPSVLVETPGGRFVLVSGGGVGSELAAGLGRRLPLLRPELDLLIVTPGEASGLDGLAGLMGRIPVRQAVWALEGDLSQAARRLQDRLVRAGSESLAAQPGQAFDLGDGARLSLLSAGSQGACLWVEWGAFRALLNPEACPDRPAEPASVLVLGDSGEEQDAITRQLGSLRPQVILAGNVGTGSEVLSANASAAGCTMLTTAHNGWIQVSTDGEQMWVEAERE